MKVNQREAVFNALTNVLADNGIDFEEGQNVIDVLNKDLRSQVHTIVCESFTQGEVEFKDTDANNAKMADSKKLSGYVSGLISNWIRKDKRLNGNTVYTPKNPGSRTGQGDSCLKALRALLKQYNGVDEETTTKIKGEIEERIQQLNAERAKKVEIDIDALPPHLVEELGLAS